MSTHKAVLGMRCVVILLASILVTNSGVILALGQQCVRANPTVIIQPISQSGLAGQQLTYNVTVINNDSPGCPPSIFLVMASFPEEGFVHVPECFRVVLTPGQSGSRDVIIKSPPNSCGGPKVFKETATNESAAGFSGSANAVFNVSPIGLNCGEGFCIPVSPNRKPKQTLQAKLHRLLAGSQIPSALAAFFFQMARRFQLGLNPANSFEQAAFSVFRNLSPEVQSALACSVRTFDSLPPQDRDRLFAPEITASGTQPVTPEALASAVSNELLRRASQQAYGDSECLFEERPGKARQQGGIDPGEVLFVPRICRVNTLRTNDYVPRLSLEQFTPEERQQLCEISMDLEQNCRDQESPCPGNNRDGSCLRVPEVRAGEAVTLDGVNFFNVDGTVRLTAKAPGTTVRDVEAHVCGDQVTPLTTTRNGVEIPVTDCDLVKDRLTFKVPEDLPVGIYSVRVIMPDNTGKGSFPLFVSSDQFVNVIPAPSTCFQIATERLEVLDETGFDRPFSDEADVRFLATPIGFDFSPGEIRSRGRRFSSADSGDPFEFNEVIFRANNISGLALSAIGFEVDSEEAFRQQVTEFIDAYELVLKSNWQLLTTSLGAIGGTVALALGLSAPWAAAIAGLITLAFNIGIAIWAPADLIIEDFIGLTAIQLATLTSPGFPAPPLLTYTTPGGIDVRVEPVSKTTQYTERRSYRSDDEGSHYRITLRYNVLPTAQCP